MMYSLENAMKNKQTKIGIVGAGTMGRGIAQVAILAGMEVRICDSSKKALDNAKEFIQKMTQRLVEKEKITAQMQSDAMSRLQLTQEIEAFSECDLVIEAIVENLEIKIGLLQKLDKVVSESCLLATNTSSLSVAKMARATQNPKRVVGLHFFNPVPLMKVVEVVAGPKTDEACVPLLKDWVRTLGHKPAVAKDSPGFIVNHAGRGYGTESLRILNEQISTPEDIDNILKGTGEFPMGPFALFDLVGLDIAQKVMESMHLQFNSEPRFRTPPLTRARVAAGLLGKKTGEGFYDYKNPVNSTPQILPRAPKLERLWIHSEEPEIFAKIVHALDPAIEIEKSERPSKDVLCLVSPLGRDATSEALRLQVDPGRCFAVDTFTDMSKQIVFMPTPMCGKADCESLQVAFSVNEKSVFIIDDSPGFVSQRVIANIVNVGCDVVHQGVTSPEELDLAVSLGLGYSQGPLALGDKYKPHRILKILNNLYEHYQDPCYRPSPWLRRRAELGMSLIEQPRYKQGEL